MRGLIAAFLLAIWKHLALFLNFLQRDSCWQASSWPKWRLTLLALFECGTSPSLLIIVVTSDVSVGALTSLRTLVKLQHAFWWKFGPTIVYYSDSTSVTLFILATQHKLSWICASWSTRPLQDPTVWSELFVLVEMATVAFDLVVKPCHLSNDRPDHRYYRQQSSRRVDNSSLETALWCLIDQPL